MSGRVVWNHSTHVDGLIPVLRRLARMEGVGTISPGRIRSMDGNGQAFRIRVTGPTVTGYKLNAKKGHTIQEVFVVTKMERPEFDAAVKEAVDA